LPEHFGCFGTVGGLQPLGPEDKLLKEAAAKLMESVDAIVIDVGFRQRP
jgi:hypothetical protein